MDFEFSVIVESIPALLAGAKLTWIIALLGISGGMAFGVVALDIFDDSLHLASAIWGLVAPPVYIEVACRGEPSGTV